MILSKDSWFVRYWIRWGCTVRGFATITDHTCYNYTGTNICQLGRIALIYAPIKTLIVGFILYNLILVPIFTKPLAALLFLIAGAGIALAAFGIIWTLVKLGGAVSKTELFTFTGEYVAAKKGRFCTKVEIE
jgi:glucan phosphoethanolaminetransferase (alkaline phosphatase superfamily)